MMMMMMMPLPQLGVIANDEASEEDRRYRNSLRQRRTERDATRNKTNVANGSNDELGLAAIVTLAPALKNGRPRSINF
jgi:hypothetical protein